MFRIRETGIGKITAELGEMQARARDLSPPLKQGKILMLRSVDLNFRSGGRPGPWAPLAASTLKQKRRLGYSLLPLQRSGDLRRSIAGEVGKNFLRLGTAAPYARFHHFGTRHMPSRRFLVFQREDLPRINELVEKHIRGEK